MRFKIWFKETVKDSSNETSWLDPNGKFHPITRTSTTEFWLSHSNWALRHNYNINELFDQGWMRVIYIGDTLYVSNDNQILPNFIQKQNLADFAIVNKKFNYIAYDNGNDEKIIWTRKKD